MSIATEISRLTTLRDNIRTKLVALGVITDSSADLEDCYTGINGITKRTTLSQSGNTITANPGYYPNLTGLVLASAVVKTPETTITSAPTITVSSAGLITATNSKTQSVTPSVTSAGYLSLTGATAGTITVSGSNTSQLTTKAATTYNVSTSNQTIASGAYLTGAQTIRAVTTSGITAANILSGCTITVGDAGSSTRIANVTGTYVPYISFSSVSVAVSTWASDTTYSDYPYRAAVACSGATAAMFPYVEFSDSDAESGNFYAVAESYAGGVYIYALEIPSAAITISTITFYKRS